jgi:DNA-binding NarL/FixJ family response regulator
LRGLDAATLVCRSIEDIEDVCSAMSATDNLIICGDMPVIESKRGRPKFVENGESRLDFRRTELLEMLQNGTKRGEIAKMLDVSRETLNKCIAANFPQFHRKKA